jgi:hypothetical protein
MQQTAQQVETFTGVVENTIPHKDIGWVRTDTGETLFFHRNYVRNHKLPEIGQRVTGRIGRVEQEDKQARAFNVEVVNGH